MTIAVKTNSSYTQYHVMNVMNAYRYAIASKIIGLLFFRIYSRATLVALYTANTSVPSTRIAGIP